MSRQEAYEVIQRNAMRAWQDGQDFRELLQADPNGAAILDKKDLHELFDYSYYLREIDRIFERAGVTGRAGMVNSNTEKLAPRSY
jgi:adenylosuccinate lyase